MLILRLVGSRRRMNKHNFWLAFKDVSIGLAIIVVSALIMSFLLTPIGFSIGLFIALLVAGAALGFAIRSIREL